jgi:hypothetical protein
MQQLRADRSAILAPGGGYGPDGPLLMFARLAVERRGGRTHPVRWQHSGDLDFRQLRGQVILQVESAVDEMMAATGAAPVVVGRAARSLTAEVVEVDGADHGMFVPGRLAASAAVLGQVITAVEDFLDRVWS